MGNPAVTGRWRQLRAGGFAVLAGQISLAGHVVAGGQLPDLPLLIAMTALVAGCALGLARQQRGFWPLLITMSITQLVFHLTLTLNDSRHGMLDADPHPMRMLVFHAVAAVLAAGLLAFGEHLLFRLLGWLSRLIPRRPAGPMAATGTLWTAILQVTRVLLARAEAGTPLSRRGPPCGRVVAL